MCLRIKSLLKKKRNLEYRSLTFAALMTARTAAAISSIQLAGSGAEEILKRIFKPAAKQNPDFSYGQILHGFIFNTARNIDEVVIGFEGKDNFSINCHGNPLIVENILELLKEHDVKIVEPEEMMIFLGRQKYGDNTIAIEADISAAQSATFDGARIIAHQANAGLFDVAKKWLKASELEDIKNEAKQILADSRIAGYFIKGAKIVIAGAPNSGKSTLFNYLCGREKAIVTDVAGTTRDWLSAQIRLKKITAEFFDTAGLDENLIAQNTIDAQSQTLTNELIKNCDLVLFVVDSTAWASAVAEAMADEKAHPTILINKLVVFNKCDLVGNLFTDGLKISAKTGSGVQQLIAEIEQRLGIADFDIKKTVCFTDRQGKILKQIVKSATKQRIDELVTELLNGELVAS